ncbi:MAG: hypothetical protein ABIO83_09020 [Ilumatobacteraceae bacterium]
MQTRVTEVADGGRQRSTLVGLPVGPNHYLVTADELHGNLLTLSESRKSPN